MCINQEVSLNTFLLGLFSVSLGFGNGILNIPSALHYMSFVSMQLVEFFAWRHLSNKHTIKILSIIGFSLILIQPLFYILSANKPSYELLTAYILFMLLVVFVLMPYYKIQFSMSKASNGHLAWHWLNYPLWVICIWFSFLVIVLISNKEYIRLTLWTVIIGYIYMLYVKTHTWGSIWCWISNGLSLILLYQIFKMSIGYGCKMV